MSREQAAAFIVKMKTDEAFHARVMALKDAAAHQQLIDDEGFDCTVEESAAAGEAPVGAADGLSEEELEWVAGGGIEPSEEEPMSPGYLHSWLTPGLRS